MRDSRFVVGGLVLCQFQPALSLKAAYNAFELEVNLLAMSDKVRFGAESDLADIALKRFLS